MGYAPPTSHLCFIPIVPNHILLIVKFDHMRLLVFSKMRQRLESSIRFEAKNQAYQNGDFDDQARGGHMISHGFPFEMLKWWKSCLISKLAHHFAKTLTEKRWTVSALSCRYDRCDNLGLALAALPPYGCLTGHVTTAPSKLAVDSIPLSSFLLQLSILDC